MSMSRTKVFGLIAGLWQEFILALSLVVEKMPVEDDFWDWLPKSHGKAAIHEAVEAAWKSLKEDYDAWKEKREKRKLGVNKAINSCTFLQSCPDLWVLDDFRTRVLAKATSSAQPVPLKSYTLERKMVDTEIEQVLGENHLFTEAELCATITKLIQEQEGGRAGQLLNNGYANLFYTSSCVVLVDWRAGYGLWRVRAWRRDDCGWYAGPRAFSPATVS